MAPDPGGVRTVGCSLEKLIPDAVVLSDIRTVVERVHLATIQVCLLLNVHVRRCLQYNISLERIFDGNYLVKAFYEVTVGDTSSCQKDPELTKSRALLENVQTSSRNGLKQLYQANANMIATVAHNNVWMHARRRLFTHVKDRLRQQSPDGKVDKLQAMRMVQDLCSPPGSSPVASEEHRAWTARARVQLGIDQVVEDWRGKPLDYHLKNPRVAWRFLKVMQNLASAREEADKHPCALFPVRRQMVPRHVRFDSCSFPKALQAMKNERLNQKKRKRSEDEITFANTLDLREAKVSQRWRVKDGFTTDGVCARLQHSVEKPASKDQSSSKELRRPPMKRISRRFPVALTPEHMTSQTCCRCFSRSGPHPELKTNKNLPIRGLRVCQNGCGLFMNRDRTSALLIGIQCQRLLKGLAPIASMTQEEAEMTLHQRSLQCESCD
tara:strand:- start:306 stop:1622 length:1317 start_codon:yes stop_codon:yes gene_type:complete